jgi:ribonuclease HI
MLVTLIADASLCHETRAAGFGYWAVSKRGRAHGGGPIRSRPQSSNAAEMMAIVNGLHCAIKRGVLCDGDEVIIQTDSQAASQAFNSARSMTPAEQECAALFLALIESRRLAFELRHVKGHTAGLDKRSYVNNVCDVIARRAMRRARYEAQQKRK